MYEVFNWGHINESRPKRLSLFNGASEINIDDPPSATEKSNSKHNGEKLNLQNKTKKKKENKQKKHPPTHPNTYIFCNATSISTTYTPLPSDPTKSFNKR